MENFEEFGNRVYELFQLSGDKFRFTYKYRHCDGKMVMKATDDTITMLYETDQLQDIKKMEKLNRNLIFNILDAPIPELPEITPPIATTVNTNTATSNNKNNKEKETSKKKNKKKGKK
ncbi:signal recognition particle, SRP9/SRP14 subunit [Neoconidiobolus thromboides FSU 785]|nr:signal recognition particle, SRP9/SRP14 subunit [Neoconidiobolus thromboides FSU 785]